MIRFRNSYTNIIAEYENLLKKSSIPELENCYKTICEDSVINVHDFIIDESILNNKIIVFAIDSLSFKFFIDKLYPFLHKESRVASLLSTFPSTTNTAWTSILSGLLPSNHGMISVSFKSNSPKGSYVWLHDEIRGIDGSVYSLLFSESILNSNIKNLFEKIDGNHTYYGKHGGSSLDKTHVHFFLSKGAKDYFPNISGFDYFDLEKILSDLKKHCNTNINLKVKGVDWIYIDVDFYIHKYGYSIDLINFFFKKLFDFIYDLKGKGAHVYMCSDHGQVDQGKVDLDIFNLPELNKNLEIPVSGAGRTLFFYPKDGKYSDLLIYLEKIIGNKGWILTKKQLVDYGIINELELNLDRIGDIVAIAKDKGFPSTGKDVIYEHGGLSEEEMIVPFVLF